MVATPRRWNRSRSGTPCNGDQLTPMSITSPNGSRRAAVRPDNSRAIDTEYGHHAPSRPQARLDPRVNRTGLLKRPPSVRSLRSRPDLRLHGYETALPEATPRKFGGIRRLGWRTKSIASPALTSRASIRVHLGRRAPESVAALHRRTVGSARRVQPPTCSHRRSARCRPREGPSAGSTSEHGSGLGARGDDDRGIAEQRFHGQRHARIDPTSSEIRSYFQGVQRLRCRSPGIVCGRADVKRCRALATEHAGVSSKQLGTQLVRDESAAPPPPTAPSIRSRWTRR